MRKIMAAVCIAGIMAGTMTCLSAATNEELALKVEQLRGYVQEAKYDRALNLLHALKGDLYDAMVNQNPPIIAGNVYKNYYYQFKIANPVTDWAIEKIEIDDEAFKKKRRLTTDLVRIKNPDSPYGLTEQLVVSSYDVGRSSEAVLVEELDFKPELYIKKLAEGMIAQRKVADSELVDKQTRVINGNPAYQVVIESDMGYDKMVRTVNLYLYKKTQAYILVFSFVMFAEQYPVYMPIYEEILNTLKFDEQFYDESPVTQKSLLDIYKSFEKK